MSHLTKTTTIEANRIALAATVFAMYGSLIDYSDDALLVEASGALDELDLLWIVAAIAEHPSFVDLSSQLTEGVYDQGSEGIVMLIASHFLSSIGGVSGLREAIHEHQKIDREHAKDRMTSLKGITANGYQYEYRANPAFPGGIEERYNPIADEAVGDADETSGETEREASDTATDEPVCPGCGKQHKGANKVKAMVDLLKNLGKASGAASVVVMNAKGEIDGDISHLPSDVQDMLRKESAAQAEKHRGRVN